MNQYSLPQFLLDCGATSATWTDGQATITFYVDADTILPELRYSDSGLDSAPFSHRHHGRLRTVRLNDRWTACYWEY